MQGAEVIELLRVVEDHLEPESELREAVRCATTVVSHYNEGKKATIYRVDFSNTSWFHFLQDIGAISDDVEHDTIMTPHGDLRDDAPAEIVEKMNAGYAVITVPTFQLHKK